MPPFLGPSPSAPGGNTPYRTTMLEIAQRFCTSPVRVKILDGLIRYRKDLLAAGITEAVQWINGSYVEDIETSVRARPPKDIDVVTLYLRPVPLRTNPVAWTAFVHANLPLFSPAHIQTKYGCDGGTIDVGLPAYQITRQITYWFGLFTHQRVSFLWKGMLQVDIAADDDDALKYMAALKFTP